MVDTQIHIKISDRPRCVYWMRALSWRISVSLIIIWQRNSNYLLCNDFVNHVFLCANKVLSRKDWRTSVPLCADFFQGVLISARKVEGDLSFFLSTFFFFCWKLELIYYRKCLKAIFFDNRWPHLRLIPVTRLSLWGHQGSARSSRGNPLVPLNN